MFCCLLFLIRHFVYEWSFDRQQADAQTTFRITCDFKSDDNPSYAGTRTQSPLGPFMAEYFANVSAVTQIYSPDGTPVLSSGKKSFFEPRLYFADTTAFQFFKFEFIHGNSGHALTGSSLIISESAARKYFREIDVVGKQLMLYDTIPLQIGGVFRDGRGPSHFYPDVLVSKNVLTRINPAFDSWVGNNAYTYIKLRDPRSARQVESRIGSYLKKDAPKEYIHRLFTYHLQPLLEIHLYSHREMELQPNGNLRNIHVVIEVGLIVLFVTLVNSSLLWICLHFRRETEMNVRRFLGFSSSGFVRRNLLSVKPPARRQGIF